MLGVLYIPTLARVTYTTAAVESQAYYVLARRLQGTSSPRIILSDVLPNCLSPVIVQGTLLLAIGIVIEASVSFVGLGVQPPTPSWGNMLADARNYLLSGDWWLSVFPGATISVSVVGFNLLGDGLRDRLRPAPCDRGAEGDMTRPATSHRPPRWPEPLLQIDGLHVAFGASGDRWREVVRGVDLRLLPGEAVGLVGESGSGKSMTALSIMQLLPPGARGSAAAASPVRRHRSRDPQQSRPQCPARRRHRHDLPGSVVGAESCDCRRTANRRQPANASGAGTQGCLGARCRAAGPGGHTPAGRAGARLRARAERRHAPKGHDRPGRV